REQTRRLRTLGNVADFHLAAVIVLGLYRKSEPRRDPRARSRAFLVGVLPFHGRMAVDRFRRTFHTVGIARSSAARIGWIRWAGDRHIHRSLTHRQLHV